MSCCNLYMEHLVGVWECGSVGNDMQKCVLAKCIVQKCKVCLKTAKLKCSKGVEVFISCISLYVPVSCSLIALLIERKVLPNGYSCKLVQLAHQKTTVNKSEKDRLFFIKKGGSQAFNAKDLLLFSSSNEIHQTQ